MKIIRRHVKLKKLSEQDDGYVDAPPEKRVSIVWELTAESWSLKDRKNVERRLQRNVTALIKNKDSTGREKDRLDVKYLRKK